MRPITIRYSIISCLLTCLVIQTGCKKENTAGPVINSVRAIDPAPNDSTLSKAGPGQSIVIMGANLATTRQIYFNGFPSPFNAALLSDNTIAVTIPSEMPFASLDPDDLNTIKVVTEYGEALYEFPIEPPPPAITAASNEYAVAGETLVLTGNNFFFIDKVVFPGGVEVTSGITTNETGTRLELTVPAGITQAGPIQVQNLYGTGTSVLLFNDLATGMLCNFDDVNTLNNWAGVGISSSSTEFPGNTGTYAHMHYTDIPANDFVWYGGGRSINCEVPLPWVPVASLNEPLGNFALKFQLNTKVPWTGGSIFIAKDYSWDFIGRVEPWKGTSNGFNTEGWRTMVVPLSNFKSSEGTGDAASGLTQLLGAGGQGGVNFFFINASDNVLTEFDAAIDNIRVVRIREQ